MAELMARIFGLVTRFMPISEIPWKGGTHTVGDGKMLWQQFSGFLIGLGLLNESRILLGLIMSK